MVLSMVHHTIWRVWLLRFLTFLLVRVSMMMVFSWLRVSGEEGRPSSLMCSGVGRKGYYVQVHFAQLLIYLGLYRVEPLLGHQRFLGLWFRTATFILQAFMVLVRNSCPWSDVFCSLKEVRLILNFVGWRGAFSNVLFFSYASRRFPYRPSPRGMFLCFGPSLCDCDLIQPHSWPVVFSITCPYPLFGYFAGLFFRGFYVGFESLPYLWNPPFVEKGPWLCLYKNLLISISLMSLCFFFGYGTLFPHQMLERWLCYLQRPLSLGRVKSLVVSSSTYQWGFGSALRD